MPLDQLLWYSLGHHLNNLAKVFNLVKLFPNKVCYEDKEQPQVQEE